MLSIFTSSANQLIMDTAKPQQVTLEQEADDYNHNSGLTRNLNDQISTTGGKYRRHVASCTLPYTIKSNIERLMIEFEQLPVSNIFDFYGRKYGQVLDAEDYGFEHGILELLDNMRETVEVFDNGKVLVCRPRTTTNHTSEILRWPDNLIALYRNSDFFNQEERLYFTKNRPKIIIDPPPLARLFLGNKTLADKEVGKIFYLFNKHPTGIPLLELNDIYFKTHKRPLNMFYFNFRSLCEMVYACPEIFYIENRINANTETQDLTNSEVILHDGRVHTHPDIKGERLNPREVDQHAIYLLDKHIIQKTLLIVHEAGSNGLPVNIYFETLRRNFKLSDKMIKYLDESMTAINVIRVLANLELIVVDSPGAANDVRIHINEKFDYVSWYGKITDIWHF